VVSAIFLRTVEMLWVPQEAENHECKGSVKLS
jgi:hypothetical protein